MVVKGASYVGVSIPQAVSAVATPEGVEVNAGDIGFNTASGKCCCNVLVMMKKALKSLKIVSIPQAVSAVATFFYVINDTSIWQ